MGLFKTAISQTNQNAVAASLTCGAASNVQVMGGKGDDTVILNGNYNEILTEEGDDNVIITGDFNDVFDDHGNNTIASSGNENCIVAMNGDNVIYSEGDGNAIYTENGNQYIESHGNYNQIDAGAGNQMIFFTGDTNDVTFGNGNSTVHFIGNDNIIVGGDGNHEVKTLDWLLAEGQYTEYADLVESYAKVSAKEQLIDSQEVNETELVEATGAEGVGSTQFQEETSTSHSTNLPTTAELISMMSVEEQSLVANLNLTEMYNGSPRYVFAFGSQDGQVHVYDMKNNKSIAKLYVGNNILVTKNNAPKLNEDGVATYVSYSQDTKSTRYVSGNYADLAGLGKSVYGEKTTTGTIDTYQVTTTYDFSHNYNAISLGHGTSSIAYTGSGYIEYGDQDMSAEGNPNVVQRGGFEAVTQDVRENLKTDIKYCTGYDVVEDRHFGSTSSQVSTGSPLIVDYNKDGQVSAAAGKGVDVDNNGKADGAATDGDKMLAMSDLNGNGKIDGSEVFGDQTVNPFTGQKINAKNGFEALKQVAISAYENTGINCMNGNDVDLQALKVALTLIGSDLGFISDNNVKNLEDLGHVKSINVSDYETQQESGDVQHNQLGSYTSTDGSKYKTDDVWFKLQ